MYYKALGYLTHNALRWYIRRRLPERRRIEAAGAASLGVLVLVGALALTVRSRRSVPTV